MKMIDEYEKRAVPSYVKYKYIYKYVSASVVYENTEVVETTFRAEST